MITILILSCLASVNCKALMGYRDEDYEGVAAVGYTWEYKPGMDSHFPAQNEDFGSFQEYYLPNVDSRPIYEPQIETEFVDDFEPLQNHKYGSIANAFKFPSEETETLNEYDYPEVIESLTKKANSNKNTYSQDISYSQNYGSKIEPTSIPTVKKIPTLKGSYNEQESKYGQTVQEYSMNSENKNKVEYDSINMDKVKKEKPKDKVASGKPSLDSVKHKETYSTKSSTQPDKSNEYEDLFIVGEASKKQKPKEKIEIKKPSKDVVEQQVYKKPSVQKEKIDEYESVSVLEEMTKKKQNEKTGTKKPSKDSQPDYHDKSKPQKSNDEYDNVTVLEEMTKKEKPKPQKSNDEYDSVTVLEEITKKEKPKPQKSNDEYDSVTVREEMTKKEKPKEIVSTDNTPKDSKLKDYKDKAQPQKERDEYDSIVEMEELTKKSHPQKEKVEYYDAPSTVEEMKKTTPKGKAKDKSWGDSANDKKGSTESYTLKETDHYDVLLMEEMTKGKSKEKVVIEKPEKPKNSEKYESEPNSQINKNENSMNEVKKNSTEKPYIKEKEDSYSKSEDKKQSKPELAKDVDKDEYGDIKMGTMNKNSHKDSSKESKETDYTDSTYFTMYTEKPSSKFEEQKNSKLKSKDQTKQDSKVILKEVKSENYEDRSESEFGKFDVIETKNEDNSRISSTKDLSSENLESASNTRVITNLEKDQVEHVLDLLNTGDNSARFMSSLSSSNLWSLLFNPTAQLQKFKKCVTRKNETGTCMNIQFCSVPNAASSLEQLLNNACIIDDIFIGVCCPEFPVETVKVEWGKDIIDSNETEFSSDSSSDCGDRPEKAAKINYWPWKAPLLAMSNGKIFCGGVLINKRHVLTAAHCTTKIPRNQILVRIGEHNSTSGEDFPVTEIKRHAQYNARTMQDDIALLKLTRSVKMGDFINSICLPDDDRKNLTGSKTLLLGWHGFRPGSIKEKNESLTVMNRTKCSNQLGVSVPNSVLCTNARNENERTCNADSGAPLIVENDERYEVLGVLSWNRNDCDPRFPSTFSNVSHYLKWIKKHSKH